MPSIRFQKDKSMTKIFKTLLHKDNSNPALMSPVHQKLRLLFDKENPNDVFERIFLRDYR